MTIKQAALELTRMLDVYETDPEEATSIERSLMTAALLAIGSGDTERAKALAEIALDAQQIPFRRT